MLVNQRKQLSSLSPTSLRFPELGTAQPQLVQFIFTNIQNISPTSLRNFLAQNFLPNSSKLFLSIFGKENFVKKILVNKLLTKKCWSKKVLVSTNFAGQINSKKNFVTFNKDFGCPLPEA